MTRAEFTVTNAHRYNTRTPVRWILSHIGRYWWLPLLIVLGNVVSSGLYSYGSVLIGDAFDVVTRAGATAGEQIWQITLLLLAVRCGVGIFDLVKVLVVETLAQSLERDAREELYISLLGKSQTFHNRQQVGDVMARATNDVQQLNYMISPGASMIVESIMFTVVPLVSIALIRADLLLVPLVFLVTFGFALRQYSRQLEPVSGGMREQFGDLNSGLAEAVAGVEVVKGYAQEPQELRKFSKRARAYRDLFIKEGQIKARYLPLLLYGMAFGVAFGHALLLHMGGALTIGQVVGFMGLMGILNFPTFISLFTFSLVQLGIASAGRILALINAETELDENAGGQSRAMQGAISFSGVSFGYNDLGLEGAPSSPVLHQISFEAQPGETIAIVGQTGSGKSTLTKLVNRTYDATAGTVAIDGVDVREWSLDSLRAQISTIEQDIFLFSRTIAENIAFGAPGTATREQIEQAAREAQAHDFIVALPEGYDTVVGERGVTLSGGQRQRLAIARAFLTNPRILILDDSTSAIDSATEDEIQKAMRKIMSNRTTLLITHRVSQIRWADRILVLRGGELVAQGSHEQLLANSEAYQRIFARYGQKTAPAPSAPTVAA
ncbi:ABC transporter ATP-binding protein [Chloroflexia bacterium SDU3-3]|nr:ABC transporter ATP-binding protein [Chloroflexia bacterium SDU3-3]